MSCGRIVNIEVGLDRSGEQRRRRIRCRSEHSRSDEIVRSDMAHDPEGGNHLCSQQSEYREVNLDSKRTCCQTTKLLRNLQNAARGIAVLRLACRL